MSTELPPAVGAGESLDGVVPAVLSALGAPGPQASALRLPSVRSAVVVLVDGMGAANIRDFAGHARFLAPRLAGSTMRTGFPATTSTALATFTTGRRSGEHGIVGYTVRNPATGVPVKQLTGWDQQQVGGDWLRSTPLFAGAAADGIQGTMVAQAQYQHSGFTQHVFAGLGFVEAETVDARCEAALRLVRRGRSLVYLYIPELDQTGHPAGCRSTRWVELLENIDAALAELAAKLPRDVGMLVTADHGMVDVPLEHHVVVDDDEALCETVASFGGEPRCRFIYFVDGLNQADRERLVSAWRVREAANSWVVSREDAVAAGYFGPVSDEVFPRLPHVILAARRNMAYTFLPSPTRPPMTIIGQHGSLTDAERVVPLLRLGAWEPRVSHPTK